VREGTIHRDLKPENIMIKDSMLKIGDFGFAKKIPSQSAKVQSAVGSPLYMPIQILKSKEYASKCDIFSLGVIFYQMLHGKTPWTAKT
jgi:serine/threonine protein kinase